MAAGAGLAAMARARTGSQLRILCYHGLWVTPGKVPGRHLWMRPEAFARRMAALRASGMAVIGLDDAVRGLAAGRLPDHAVVITIDDGWRSTWTHMLPVLEQHALPATLYATTWYADRGLPVINVALAHICHAAGNREIAPRALAAQIDALPLGMRLDALRRVGRMWKVPEDWLETRQFELMGRAELADAAARGLDIQLHTHRHIDVAATPERLADEVGQNARWLASVVPADRLRHFCYPSGSWHPMAPQVLADAGMLSATLTDQGLNAPDADPLGLRRFLDGHVVSQTEFEAYLSGTLHYLSAAAGWMRRRGRAWKGHHDARRDGDAAPGLRRGSLPDVAWPRAAGAASGGGEGAALGGLS